MRAPYRADQLAAQDNQAQDADVENPETNYAIAPDGVYLAYQTLGTGEPPPRLADGLAREHRLRMG